MGGALSPVAFGFPGQGGDWGDALRRLERHPHHRLVQRLAERLGTDRWEQLDQRLGGNSQPVVFTAGAIAAEVARRHLEPEAMAGHSFGLLTAAVGAGAIHPTAGLDLACLRAELSAAADAERPGAMAVIASVDTATAAEIAADASSDSGPAAMASVAVVNGPRQTVVSGDRDAVARAVERAGDRGAVARLLPIAGAFHSPLLAPAVPRWRDAVAGAVTADPAVPVVSSTAPAPLQSAGEVAGALAGALTAPVDWPGTVSVLVSLGATHLYDLGPGDTLVRLARQNPSLGVSAGPG